MIALQTIIVVLLLLLLHELGHVLAAKALGLSIEKVGFTLRPWPHPFVAVRNVSDDYRKVVFLSAGLGCTLLLFAAAWASDLLSVPFIYYAFSAEIILETNPFYSDFTTMFNTRQQHAQNYEAYYRKGANPPGAARSADHLANGYYFGTVWYGHLLLWVGITNLLLAPPLLRGYFLP